MSNRYLIKKNKSKKGISPVIATVILVAVAVVIAAALAGFSGSLFGSYSNGPQTKLQSLTLTSGGDLTMDMSNAGNAADQVSSVTTTLAGATATYTPGAGVIQIEANSPVQTYGPFATGFTGLIDGQQVTIQVHMLSGQVITQTVTVTP